MKCPVCNREQDASGKFRLVDIYKTEKFHHSVRRYYRCKGCGSKFTTLEVYDNNTNSSLFEILEGIRNKYQTFGAILNSILTKTK